MSYQTGQLQQSEIASTTSITDDRNTKYMTVISNGRPVTRSTASGGLAFIDSGVQVGNYESETKFTPVNLTTGTPYYLRIKVKQEATENQKFKAYLIHYDSTSNNTNTQYIKTINISAGDSWEDAELVFTPLEAFDCVLFELSRNSSTDDRTPIILYVELSQIINTVPSSISPYIKIGVSSSAGMLMCINKQPIRVHQSGVYELNNKIITIDFFSVINAASDEISTTDDEGNEYTSSTCIFDKMTKRGVKSFILDYVYEKTS